MTAIDFEKFETLSKEKKNELNNFEFPAVDLLCDYDTEKSENEWIVTLKELVCSDEFQNSEFELPVALGKSADKKPVVADLAQMPHLIISGTYGMGSHSCIHSILVSLLYKKHPAELKIVMIDTKRCDYNQYDTLESHYLSKLPDATSPIISGTRSAIDTLNSLCREMENRYDLLRKAKVSNIKEYNSLFRKQKLPPTDEHRYLPYIAVIIDDYRQLVLPVGKMAEKPILQLARHAHTTGIHLVIVTQRPNVHILTDNLNSLIPSRIAFRVKNAEESRTILGVEGAERLRGNGDMLLSIDKNNLVRLQGCFIGESEVDAVIQHISTQPGCPQPYFLPKCDGKVMSNTPDELDPDFVRAATLVVEAQQASVAFLQRNMLIGYNRAGHLMDQLEEFGIVTSAKENEERKVKIKTEHELGCLINYIFGQ